MSSQPGNPPSRRFWCIRNPRDDTFFDAARSMWWGCPMEATKFLSQARANAYASEFDVNAMAGCTCDLVSFTEQAPPVSDLSDDSDGEWWKD